MSNAIRDYIRCFLCRKKNSGEHFYRSVNDAICPASKKCARTVLLHLARLGKFELHLPSNECLCRNCYLRIADYDTNLVSLMRMQKELSLLVEKAATSFESDIEEECLRDMSNMTEFNEDNFFEDTNVSDREISQTIFEVIGKAPNRCKRESQDRVHNEFGHKIRSESPESDRGKPKTSEQIQCNLCAMRFKNRVRLQKHVVQAHKKFSCNICSFSHRNEDYVMLHMNVHEGKNENQCRFCNKEFTTKISTIRHMEVHLDTKKYQCDKCGLCFSQTTVLYNHKLQHEAEEKPLRCEICNQIFKTKRTFRHHMLTHRADRPRYSCEFCGKTFTEKYTLKVHKRTHPEADRQAAPTTEVHNQQHHQLDSENHHSYPQIVYNQSGSLLQQNNSQTPASHITTSPNPKCICIICDQSFITKDHLNKHMEKDHDVIIKSLTIANFSQYEVVTNEPRKPCHICGQIFSAQHNLDCHLEHVHALAFK